MNCNICPRECGADRENGKIGLCGCDDKIYISRAALHCWEEPPISYKKGSGTVFFSGCNLKCVFCQNREISRKMAGKAVTADRLYEIFQELKSQGAHNINLVTPTHYTEQLIPVLKRAKEEKLGLPIVWNSGGYEKAVEIKKLRGLVDIYLPDMKYIRAETAKKYSGAGDYFTHASKALDEMVSQIGTPIIHRGTMRRGVIVRHLILPGRSEESKEIIKYLYSRYGDKIYISIMNQYTPMEWVKNTHPELYSKVTEEEYSSVVEYAKMLGVQNAFIQDGNTAEESYIPPFDNTGV